MPLRVRMESPAKLKDKGMAYGPQMVDQLRKKYPDRVTAEMRKEFYAARQREHPSLEGDRMWTAEDQRAAKEIDTRLLNELLNKAGFDGIEYVNRWEAPGSKSGVVFDASQLRSRFAAFDPTKRDSADLLATGVLAAGAAAATGKYRVHDIQEPKR